MIVTWTIPEQACPLQQQNAKVFYSRNNNSSKQLQSSIAEMESFKDLDIKYCTYRALLNFLKPNTTYCKFGKIIQESSSFILLLSS